VNSAIHSATDSVQGMSIHGINCSKVCIDIGPPGARKEGVVRLREMAGHSNSRLRDCIVPTFMASIFGAERNAGVKDRDFGNPSAKTLVKLRSSWLRFLSPQ